MVNKSGPSWLIAGLALALACVSAVTTAAAQQQRYYRGGGFFDQLFGGGRSGGGYYQPMQPREYSGEGDSTRAPSPKKADPAASPPTTTVMVMGDAMADWLAYGLEDAFADAPEIGVLRRHKAYSGLIRYEQRSDLDWWHVARDLLAKDKVDYVVMMLGTGDRQSLRETAADRKKKEPEKPAAAGDQTKPGQTATNKQDDDEAIVAPEPSGRSGVSSEFRSERWEQVYSKRIDETIAALKSKGVPVIWVGLPPIRGTRSTADTQYLNQLYRARAEAAGIVYVDVWDGFVDEGGKFTYQGPDFEGQTRRLRSGDGVHFTKAGSRKLAHYVERELRRLMSNRSMPMAMPSVPGGPQLQGAPNEPAVRPVAGPVVPLTAPPSGGEELLGGRGTSPIHADATAARVLVKGEPVPAAPGRADDFQWPRGGDAAAAAAVEPLSPTAAAARDTGPAKPEPKKGGAKEAARTEPPKQPAKETPAARQQAEPKPAVETKPRPQQHQAATQQQRRAEPATTAQGLRPPAPVRPQQPAPQYQQRPQGGLFGLFR